MKKQEFLNKLSKKLSILNENEKKDIINEYTDIIDEKIKHGKTEEEAINDFGNIENLAKEILSAYKIDPNYEEEKKQSKISQITKNIATKLNSREINLKFIFEIILKIFITIIGMLILKGIFHIFSRLGNSLFNGLISPFDDITSLIWSLFLVIMYILISILLIIALFKNYFKSETNSQTVNIESNEPMPPKTTKSIGDILLLIIKIIVIIYFFIPLIILLVFLLTGLLVSIFYLTKGINLLGLIILLIGAITICTYIAILVFNLLYSKKTPNIIYLFTGIILSALGAIMFINMIINIDYIDKAPTKINQKTISEEFTTDKKVLISGENIKLKTDNTLKDGTFKITTTYNKNYSKISFTNTDNYRKSDQCIEDDDDYFEDYETNPECQDKTLYTYIHINNTVQGEFIKEKEIYKEFINNLKNNKIYNYEKLYTISVTVSANDKTLQDISLY